MNAPFAPQITQRDAFNAFACDTPTLELIQSVAGEMGWPAEKCQPGGLRTAIQQLSVVASPSILVVDLSESIDPIEEINNLAEVCEPGTIVIALGQINDVRLYRDLMVNGIQDYLLKPFSADQLRETLIQAQTVLAGPRASDHIGEQQHAACAVVGVRGGCGASTLTTSIAWLMSEKLKRHTAILDLDVHFGTDALGLDLEPGRGLTDAIENPSRIDGLFIERAMVRATEHLSILSAEASIEQPVVSDGTAYQLLLEEMQYSFEMTLVDLPRQSLILLPSLLERVTSVVLVTQFTLAAARDTIRLLSWLKAHASDKRVVLVANRVLPAGGEISRADFEKSIERKVDLVITEDPKLFAEAAKFGKAVADVARGSKAGQALEQLAALLLPATGEEIATTGKAGRPGGAESLLDKFSLSSILPKRAPKSAA